MVIYVLQKLLKYEPVLSGYFEFPKNRPPSSSLKLFPNQTTIGSGSLKIVQNQNKPQSHHNRIDSFQ